MVEVKVEVKVKGTTSPSKTAANGSFFVHPGVNDEKPTNSNSLPYSIYLSISSSLNSTFHFSLELSHSPHPKGFLIFFWRVCSLRQQPLVIKLLSFGLRRRRPRFDLTVSLFNAVLISSTPQHHAVTFPSTNQVSTSSLGRRRLHLLIPRSPPTCGLPRPMFVADATHYIMSELQHPLHQTNTVGGCVEGALLVVLSDG
eukprot:scaffold143289_cov43-Cyclotella_meneghiniana.AAC.2